MKRGARQVTVERTETGAWFAAELSPGEIQDLERQGWSVRFGFGGWSDAEKLSPAELERCALRRAGEERQRRERGPVSANTGCKSLARRATSSNGSAHAWVYRQCQSR